MENKELYLELKQALFKLVSHDTDDESKSNLKIAVDRYFENRIYHLSSEELLGYLASPQKLVRDFKAFIKSEI